MGDRRSHPGCGMVSLAGRLGLCRLEWGMQGCRGRLGWLVKIRMGKETTRWELG